MISPKITNLGYSNLWTDMSTILGYASTLDQQIQKLFANGEQGFFCDPSDLSTMYLEATSPIPVTAAGQPVGLMLDKSKGFALGGEAVVGGNFESGLIGTLLNSGSSAATLTLNTVSPISGTQDAKITVTAVDGLNPQLRFNRNVPRIVGALYEVSFDYKVISGTPYVAQIYNGSGTSGVTKALQGSGRFAARYLAIGTGTSFDQIYFSLNTFEMQIDNVSCKQVLGNHAYQTTSSMRPLLVASPQRLDYDNIDDKLITNLSTQLTDCTVVRSVPNVGTQILTGQTIPATYEDNTDHCGLLVINRALTPSETSAITAEFNKRAGV